MNVYTRTGDEGETALVGGQRVLKSHARVRAYGAIDEANSTLGLARAVCQDADLEERLEELMSDLFDVGAELATPQAGEEKLNERLDSRVDGDRVQTLEAWIDEAEAELPPLKTFVLPTGCDLASRLQFARSVLRRAEREVVDLHTGGTVIRDVTLRFLNRLSDLLFVWGRLANHRAGVGDVPWRAKKPATPSAEKA